MTTDIRKPYIYDLEIFSNYFLAMFYDIGEESFSSYTIETLDALRQFLKQELILIGYNNRGYDDIVLHEIIDKRAASCSDLYDLSTKIISGGARKDPHLKKALYKETSWGSIDLMQIKPPSLSGRVFDWSLKKHQIRLRWDDVRDLPYPFDRALSEEEKQEVFNYCKNDVLSTNAVYTDFSEQGVLDVAIKIQELYPFVGTKPFNTSHASLGAEIMKVLYRKNSGIPLYKDIKVATKEAVFEPSRHINDLITFTDPRNRQALEYMKSIPSENIVNLVNENGRKVNRGCKDWGNKHLKDIRFYAGDTEFRIGVGGIHTDFPQRHVNGNLIDFDVTSYYPSLIKQINRSPLGLTDEWIKQFNNPHDKRVMFKRQGDKLSADVMKIVINSVYGQLNYPKSDSFDPTLQLEVTLNGQLMLVMLAEMFVDEGYEIVSANTDGITIDVKDRKMQAIDVGNVWSKITGHNLEHTEYKQYVAVSVNDYFAVTHEGDVKAKGWFRPASGLSPAVLPRAVIQYFMTGTSIDAYVREQKSIFDFINSGRAPKDSDVTWKNKGLQRTNRWYRSCNGEPIFYTKTGEGEKKRRKLSGSDDCVPVNTISSTTIPDDLDYIYYTAEAEKVVSGIENNLPSTRKDTGELLYQAKKLAEQGLTTLPKGRKDSPKANYPGSVPTEIPGNSIDEYPWYLYNGVGIVTGPGLNTIAIDIDYLDIAVRSGLFNHTQKSKSHLTAWHGPGKRANVASGTCRGTMIFEYNGDLLKPTDGNFLQEYGFEILYDKSVAQALGVHDIGEPYQFQGTLKQLPKKLEKFLSGCQEAHKRFVDSKQDDDGRSFTIPKQPVELSEHNDNHQINQLTKFRDVANAVPEYKGSLTLGEYKGLNQLVGPCPYNHDDDTGDHFQVYYDDEKSVYRPHCFHKKCKATITRFTKHVSENIITRVKDVQTIPCLTEEQTSVRQSLKLPDRIKTILAPTGTGKTYETAYFVAKALEHVTDEKYVILCCTKGQMIQYCKELQGFLQTDNLNELGIDLIESSSSIEEGSTKSRNDVRDNTI